MIFLGIQILFRFLFPFLIGKVLTSKKIIAFSPWLALSRLVSIPYR